MREAPRARARAWACVGPSGRCPSLGPVMVVGTASPFLDSFLSNLAATAIVALGAWFLLEVRFHFASELRRREALRASAADIVRDELKHAQVKLLEAATTPGVGLVPLRAQGLSLLGEADVLTAFEPHEVAVVSRAYYWLSAFNALADRQVSLALLPPLAHFPDGGQFARNKDAVVSNYQEVLGEAQGAVARALGMLEERLISPGPGEPGWWRARGRRRRAQQPRPRSQA